MKKLLFVLILMLIFQSCQNTSKDYSTDVPEKLNINIETEVYDIETINRNYEIKLSTDSLFHGMIHKMMIRNDTIYILDTQKAPGLYLYDEMGRLLNVYDKIGQGVGEFVNVIDFQIDDGFIYLLDSHQANILKLNRDCQYLSTINGVKNANSFAMGSVDDIWYDMGNYIMDDSAKLICMSSQGKSSVLNVPSHIENITISPLNTLIKINDEIHYLPALENVIYECKDNVATKKYFLDFGNLWPSESFWVESKKEHPLMIFRKLSESGYVYELNFQENLDVIHLNFKCGTDSYWYFYDKRNMKQKLLKGMTGLRPCCIYNEKLYVISDIDPSCIMVYSLATILQQKLKIYK